MKKYIAKIIAIVLVVLFFIGQSNVNIIAASLDNNINMSLLGDSGSDTSVEPEEVDFGNQKDNTDDSKLDLGTSADKEPLGLSVAPMMAPFAPIESIGGIIPITDQNKMVIVPGTGGESYIAFPGTVDGLKEAVLKLYNEGAGRDFVLYIGTNINIPSVSALVSEPVAETPTAATVSFTALKGKVGNLVITSSPSDPQDSTTAPPADTAARIITLSTDWYFGTNVTFRNIRYNPNSIFARGNKIVLDRGSLFTAGLQLYGGTKNGDLTANPTVIINATGIGVQDFYGGNKEGGTITGNSSVSVNSTYNHAIRNLSGGAYIGTITGDVDLVVNNSSYNIEFIFGGGEGLNINQLANVGGNVSTTINGIGGSFTRMFGGTHYGNINGSVTNNFRGSGKFVVTSEYYGGSNVGSIGSGLASGSDAITNFFDSSQYTAGNVEYSGGNRFSGIVKGNIKSKITSTNAGPGYLSYIRRVSGAGSIHSYTTGVVINAYDSLGAEQASLAAENAATFKVYGNVYTEITKGIVSSGEDTYGYTYGAGMGGFVKGNATIEIGTEGLVTSISANTTSTAQIPTNNTRGVLSNYDIVGGGGAPGAGNVFFLHGDSKVIMHNVIARWTYGANFSGCTYGNSRIEQYGGVVDTLEGAGYNGRQMWGNANAYLMDGQVDWFLSGGGWNDYAINGNVSAVVENGTVNAHLGGTYGAAVHTIYGNAEILVKGGDFSGRPRTGPTAKTFAGGVSNDGYITGSTKLTLDLRGAARIVGLPTGSAISGGKPFDAVGGSRLGENETKTIELNIYTDTGNDFLNGANIYGDGGGATTTKSGKITVNIDAPGSTVGNFYATQYSNIYNGKILRNVDFNVVNVGTVTAMSGGSAIDNFTNAIVNVSTNKVTMNFNPMAEAASAPKSYSIGTGGAYNFTEFNVDNAVVKLVGGIKNGYSATAANHGTSYHQFGNINLVNNAGLSISNLASAMISANMLAIQGKTTLESPSGTGKVVITDINMGTNSSIFWTRNGGTPVAQETGYWYGVGQAYKVITFNPTRANAQKLTPHNFYGRDDSTLLMGDNETVSNASNGHAIALPGTRLEFKVMEGKGTIKHNVSKVLESDTRPLNGASSVDKDVPVSDEGWLSFVDSFVGAKLTFTPDVTSGSWLKKVVITRDDGVVTEISESTSSDPVDWLVTTKGHTYTVGVYFSDQAELTGRNVIINETEAAAISSATDITTYQQVSGRPFLTNDIDSAMIADINQPLPINDKVRTHTVTYTVGTGGSMVTQSYLITVVGDETTIHQPSRSVAIYANDATMMLAVAQSINSSTLDTSYTKAYAIQEDGTIANPSYELSPIAALNGLANPATVPVTYKYSNIAGTSTVNKAVSIVVIPDGVLQFDTIPKLEFGQTTLLAARTDYWMPSVTTLIVEDSRINPFGSSWTVTVKVSDLEAVGGKKIPASDISYTNKSPSIGPVGKFPVDSGVTIWNSTTIAADTQSLQWPANGDYGFSVVLDAAVTKIGNYSGKATWSLIQGP